MTQLAAFVFSELVEVSATLASLGEARSERARRAYFDLVRTAIASSGGRELVNDGDGVLAAFEGASDALTFAACVQRGCDRESRRSSERLDVRIGIDVGEAASLGAGGDAHTVAAATRARLLARSADAGSVLASSVVAAVAAGADARFRSAGLLDLPGASEPVPAVEVMWERAPATQPPLPAELESGLRQAPFVGRDDERKRLRSAWLSAQGGDRRLVFVVGEPGIGKTRLVAEFARGLYEEGAGVLWGRSFEEALTPYQPFVQALQHHVRSTPPEELREQVGSGAGVLARLLPELRARLPVEPVPVEEPENERYRLFEAVSHLLRTASAERPVLLVLDDLQWADQGTLLLLKHLARDPAPAPLLLLGTYRHSEVGRDHPLALVQADVERDRIIERIELSGLAEDEVHRLVGGLIGWEPPEEMVHGLRAETQGNPFFLEELVRHLEQLGLDADSARLEQVQATVQELGVPSRVRELVSRRVRRLSLPTQEALAAAAVIGGEFDSAVLAEVLARADESELVDSLDEAVEGRLLAESLERVGHYVFSHALIQQALYEEQTLNHRAAFHERVAASLERLGPIAPARAAEIAYHYARAGDRNAEKVVRYGRAAGEHGLALYAYEDAVRELSSALEALELVVERNHREQAELLTLLGTALTRSGDHAAARASFHEAAELAAEVGAWPVLAHAVLGYGGGTHFGGVWETLATTDDELIRLLELALAACPAGDSPERVRLLARLAQAIYWTPDAERRLELSEKALAIARRLDDPAALAHALDSRNVALWSPDHLDERRVVAEEIQQIGRELADRDIQLEALCWLVIDELERGAIGAADELIAEHARIASELRQPYHLWFTQTLRVMRAHLEGRFDEADRLCEQTYAFGAHVHDANAFQVHLAQRLFLRIDEGRVEELLEELQGEAARRATAPIWRAAGALALAELGRREEALEQVGLMADLGFASIPRDCMWVTTIVGLARTIAGCDDPTHADELYELLLPFADRTCIPGGPVLCLDPISLVLGMLARTAGRPALALEHLSDALERSCTLGPPLVARTKLETAKAHLLRGGDDDRAAVERLLGEAGAIAASLGMRKVSHDAEVLRNPLTRGALT